jgi:hypothetical protein
MTSAKSSDLSPSNARPEASGEVCLTESDWKSADGGLPPGAKKTVIADPGRGSGITTLSERYCYSAKEQTKPGKGSASGNTQPRQAGESNEKKKSPIDAAIHKHDSQSCDLVANKLIAYIQQKRSSEELNDFNKKNSKALSNMNSEEDGCQVTLGVASELLSENLSEQEQERIAQAIEAGNYDAILNGSSSRDVDMAPEHSSPVRNVSPESLEPVSH